MIPHPRLIDRITRLRGLDGLTGSEMDAIQTAERAYYDGQESRDDAGRNDAANRLALSLALLRGIERNHGVEVEE